MDFEKLKYKLLDLYRDEISFFLENRSKAERKFYVDTRYCDEYCGRKFDWIQSCWFEGDNNFVQVILSHADSPAGTTWDCITIDLGYTLDGFILEIQKDLKEEKEYV